MKSICTERAWEFPWEQEYEEYLESQEDGDDETTAELIEEDIPNSSKNNNIVLQGIK